MEGVNLYHLVNYYNSVQDAELVNLFVKHHGQWDKHDNKNTVKKIEFDCISSLVDKLLVINSESIEINQFNNFYLGFIIPQIGKEFDLLKMDSEQVINIELKSKKTENEKKQLKQNKHYLKHLGKKMYQFTYILEEDVLYFLDDEENLIKSDFSYLFSLIKSVNNQKNNLYSLFDPTKYMISPLNQYNKFIKKEYYLTNQQEELKKKINNQMLQGHKIIKLSAEAGTGKTLLMLDITRELIKKNRVLFVHCGNLAEGHERLNLNFKKLRIISIKDLNTINLKMYNYIFIDEAQRITLNQFNYLEENIRSSSTMRCVLSLDPKQVLSKREILTNIDKKLNKIINKDCSFTLKGKVRNNKHVERFIRILFDENKYYNQTENIHLLYAENKHQAKEIIKSYQKLQYKFVNYTPSIYYFTYVDNFAIDTTSHRVIGQEFDKVVTFINQDFHYQNGELKVIENSGIPYEIEKMLYQTLTRAREKICLIVINNLEIYNNILKRISNGEYNG